MLLVNQPATLNITLKVGSSTTTVDVVSDRSALNAVGATIGTPFNQTQIQSSIGGPVVKDKLFCFTSYEADKIAQNQQVINEVPLGTTASPGLRQRYLTYVNAQGGTTTLSPSTIAQMDPHCSGEGTCPLGPGVDSAALQYFATLPAANGSLLLRLVFRNRDSVS